MPNYVWTVKNRFGDPQIKEVVAETADQSKAQLLAEGCTDLELVGNEITDAVLSARPPVRVFGEEITVTAAQRLAHYNTPAKTFASVLRDGIRRTKFICIIIPVLALYQLFQGNYLSAILCLIGLLAWLVFLITNGLPSIYFRRLNKALDWSRWTEVLSLVEKIELINRFHFNKVPPFYLARSRAKALAGCGSLSEALAAFAPFENQPSCPGWMYKMLLASIYDTARQYDEAVRYTRMSIAEKPTAAGWLDLANRLARRIKDSARAREAIGEAEKMTLTGLEETYYLRCRGIVFWMEGNFPSAKDDLQAALIKMEQKKNLPGMEGIAFVNKGFLCCVLAKLGDVAGAKECFSEAREYLVATQEKDLLKDCEAALKAAPAQ